jgi:AcrR family transcriptional regulator
VSANEERRERRRNEILDAAHQVFLDKGYHPSGIADVASALGIGHGTVYRYFSNKRDLALAVLDRVIARFATAGLTEDPTESTTLEEYRAQVERILGRLIDVTFAEPNLLRFLDEQGLVIAPDKLREFKDQFAMFTTLFLNNGVERGFLRRDLDVEPTAQALVALIFEGVSRAGAEDPEHATRWMNAGVGLMFDGLRARD